MRKKITVEMYVDVVNATPNGRMLRELRQFATNDFCELMGDNHDIYTTLLFDPDITIEDVKD